jgi:methylenetetrahydrofolate dehydrogenase (NADP+)/methenyltetrahydrofolate cyclohydrolase
MARSLGGTEVVDALNGRIAEQVEELKARGVVPTLAIVRLGERGDDISYERGATKRATQLGVAVKSTVLPADASEEELLAVIEALNSDNSVHGVLLFRPLPSPINEETVRNTLDPRKDIDGITDISLGSVFTGGTVGYAPCTAVACMEVLDHYGIDCKGKHAVVVGRSLVIGKPVAMMLLARHATVSIAHSRTVGLPSLVSQADLVIACVGRAGMIDADYLSEGQTVIDVGINVTDDNRLVGDVDFAAAQNIVAAITPVPGGVGTVTTSVLVKHVVDAAHCNLA